MIEMTEMIEMIEMTGMTGMTEMTESTESTIAIIEILAWAEAIGDRKREPWIPEMPEEYREIIMHIEDLALVVIDKWREDKEA